METMADGGLYITTEWMRGEVQYLKNPKPSRNPSDWKTQMAASIDAKNTSKTNDLYFRRFLDIYGNMFTEKEIADFKKEMRARCKKAEIVYEHIMHESEVGYKDLTAEIAKHSDDLTNKSLRIAKWSLVAILIGVYVTLLVSL
jgi:predicted secreted protein